jgi:hypothetical protein
VKFPHHLAEAFRVFEIAEGVVMVIGQRRDPGDETVLSGPMVEAIPEDQLGLLGSESGKTVAASSGDEIDGVVAIPVLKAVFVVPMLVGGVGAGWKRFMGVIIPCPT